MLSVLGTLGRSLTWRGRSPEETLGASLAAARRQAVMSQRTMAAMIGVTQPTIVAIERRTHGRMQTFEQCLNALTVRASVLHENLSSEPKGRRLVPARNSPLADIVYAPRSLAKAVIDHHPLTGIVLDPCRGDGSFFDQFPDHVDARWSEVVEGQDFTQWQAPVDWIVTNPPWLKFRSFLNHSMNVAENVVYLAQFNHYGRKTQLDDIRRHGFGIRSMLFVPTPQSFPHSGLQLCAV
jgi:transcriptional regulator with XRE-family HTH domain